MTNYEWQPYSATGFLNKHVRTLRLADGLELTLTDTMFVPEWDVTLQFNKLEVFFSKNFKIMPPDDVDKDDPWPEMQRIAERMASQYLDTLLGLTGRGLETLQDRNEPRRVSQPTAETTAWETTRSGGRSGVRSKRLRQGNVVLTLMDRQVMPDWDVCVSVEAGGKTATAHFDARPQLDEKDPWPEMQRRAEQIAGEYLGELAANAGHANELLA